MYCMEVGHNVMYCTDRQEQGAKGPAEQVKGYQAPGSRPHGAGQIQHAQPTDAPPGLPSWTRIKIGPGASIRRSVAAITGAQIVPIDSGAKNGGISSGSGNTANGRELISLYLPKNEVQLWMASSEQH